MKKVREDFERFRTRLKLGQPIPSDELNNKIEFAKELDDK